jgi:hypothetical protein
MKVLLVYRDRDFDPQAPLPAHGPALAQDLGVDALADAMGGEDAFLHDIARKVILGSTAGDVETIRYRQGILGDCLRHTAVAQRMYDVAVGAIEAKRTHWYFGATSRYPPSILSSAVELMKLYVGSLRELRAISDAHAAEFASEGLRRLCAMLAAELPDAYLARIEAQLAELEFRHGILITATLGTANEITGHVLRRPHGRPGWMERWFGKAPPGYTVKLAERDEPGARALGDLRDRGIIGVANALAQSVDHVESFFIQLRSELAFYLGCASLHGKLAALGAPTCIPDPAPRGSRARHATGLYDPTLALAAGCAPVRSDLAADGASLVVITGANQGGKTTFLRALGVAQLMLHAGMFVAAEAFSGETTSGVFTHWKREEDTALQSGKLDEELRRVSDLAEALAPDAFALFNESFASTNEREGSELARQIVRALVERRVVVAFVTHLYDFAHTVHARPPAPAVFLRAERRDDGTRTFKLVPAPPLATSFGADLYAKIFGGPLQP